jgi:hypothetical protein
MSASTSAALSGSHGYVTPSLAAAAVLAGNGIELERI